MTKMGAFIFLLILVLMPFQNCQKAPLADSQATSVTNTQNTANKVDLSAERISEVSFVFQEVETVARGTKTYQIAIDKNLKVNLQSGEMFLTSDLDGSENRYCLPAVARDELVTILKSSSVCVSSSKSQDQVCAQVIKKAYARLETQNDTYSLGSATDSCGSNLVDLCDQSSELLKGFAAAVKAKYKTYSCP